MDQYELIRTAQRVYGKSIREIKTGYGASPEDHPQGLMWRGTEVSTEKASEVCGDGCRGGGGEAVAARGPVPAQETTAYGTSDLPAAGGGARFSRS